MLISQTDSKNRKLKTMTLPLLKELAGGHGVNVTGGASDIILRLVGLSENDINSFIKDQYSRLLQQRQAAITDEQIKAEVSKVTDYHWGVVQGQLDAKIQKDYVRKFAKYDDLISNVVGNLHSEITQYVVASWFNHWTTVLIEDHISTHPKVVPTIKHLLGVDIFIQGQPFDLKITYLPRGYRLDDAQRNPASLTKWLYEKQGAQRFGSGNRFFIVLADAERLENSWKLKRDFDYLFTKIDAFLQDISVSSADEIVFSYNKTTHTTHGKLLLITR